MPSLWEQRNLPTAHMFRCGPANSYSIENLQLARLLVARCIYGRVSEGARIAKFLVGLVERKLNYVLPVALNPWSTVCRTLAGS